MNNYTYIVSSLPIISGDATGLSRTDVEKLTDEIRGGLEKRDVDTLDFFLSGFDASNLTEDFYRKAQRSGNTFVRDYFAFDMNVRNARAKYLNARLGRPALQDTISICQEGEEPEFEEAVRVERILHGQDIIAREKELDDLMWDKIGELTVFNYFDMNAILAFVAKMMIALRWLSLDERRGRELFRTLAEEVRGTFKGVEF